MDYSLFHFSIVFFVTATELSEVFPTIQLIQLQRKIFHENFGYVSELMQLSINSVVKQFIKKKVLRGMIFLLSV